MPPRRDITKLLDGKRGVFSNSTDTCSVVLCARHRSKTWAYNGFATDVLYLAPEFHKERLCECCLAKLGQKRDAITGRLKPSKASKKGRKRR